ncbi:hypothetical protein CBR_g49610 [Chara braunii]|uniref:Uncharacterized protein n=1 Tax=Chara braunii TaxID=69332 RepID=A0A388M594_CHABU|nr:hypothetical protein CBR_g49610 [Chara braunii]|eukprot:GBG89758.1 hypothetical protein CBR_g49610 [Chara braunii]
MRPIGVEATLAADGRQIRADEMDIGATDTRDRTEMDIGTTDTRDQTETGIRTTETRGRVEMATEVVGMKEEIGTGNDEMGCADGLSEGEMRESSATSRGGGTTEGTDATSHEGDMTQGTAGMIREGGMSKEGLEETGATICAVGMREGDMASHQNHIPSRLTPRRPGVRSLEAQTTGHLLPGTHASTVEEKIISRGVGRTSNGQ